MLSSRFGSSGIKAVNQPPWLWIPPPIWDTPGLAACLTSDHFFASMSLSQFPEELLERILAHAVASPPAPHPRAPWHRAPHPQDIHGRLAPLLVNRPFARIALPPFYHTLVLHSPSQARACLQTLRARPELARAVRVLVLASSAPGRAEAEVLALLTAAASTHAGPGLKSLDLTLPAPGSPSPSDALALAEAIHQLHALEVLTIRKAAGTYLSQPAPRAVLEACAAAVDACTELHTLTLTFPLAPDPALLPLVAALALAPALRTLACPMPAMWTGESLWLRVASNPALERICLDAQAAMPSSPPRAPERRYTAPSAPAPPYRRPLLPTSLFLAAARPHARLSALIRAGTHILPVGAYSGGGWRGRAATVGSVSASSVYGGESASSVYGEDESVCPHAYTPRAPRTHPSSRTAHTSAPPRHYLTAPSPGLHHHHNTIRTQTPPPPPPDCTNTNKNTTKNTNE
ncbi:hypothetical protein C8F04DRAFT_1391482 [Mycena alexandri]|uniref:Uncharacterized protein n=1 Tax=Mycena alexandri TaxID=1745969 RepID=A0AAD6XDA0_9AGAR|nr:hypothetical protein C8F04DRAFT_1391482 [Mycena alexandri]